MGRTKLEAVELDETTAADVLGAVDTVFEPEPVVDADAIEVAPETEPEPEPAPEPEPGVEEPSQPADGPALPDVQVVFDTYRARLWLAKAYNRVFRRYSSVRIDVDGIPEKQLPFVVALAARAVRQGGDLYVPESLAGVPALKDAIRMETFAGYVHFRC